MTIGGSIFLIVVGAILKYAIADDTLGSVNIDLIGLILMIAGLAGLLLGLYFWSSASRRSAVASNAERETVVERRSETDL